MRPWASAHVKQPTQTPTQKQMEYTMLTTRMLCAHVYMCRRKWRLQMYANVGSQKDERCCYTFLDGRVTCLTMCIVGVGNKVLTTRNKIQNGRFLTQLVWTTLSKGETYAGCRGFVDLFANWWPAPMIAARVITRWNLFLNHGQQIVTPQTKRTITSTSN